MLETAPKKYMAFISYRHADNSEQDRQWATWLHQQLEVYDVPGELIGKTNQRGEIIPERIYPVFRDEVALAADANLSVAINQALEQTNQLIVLCSPRAVQSKYVNDEIRYFKQLGRAEHISAAIILGEPNASEDEMDFEDANTLECFPEALRYQVNDQGEMDYSQAVEPLAANFRLPTDGKGITNPAVYKQQLLEQGRRRSDAERLSAAYEEQINTARLKLIARVLGVTLEELTQRDKVYQLNKARVESRKARKTTALVSVFLVLALVGGAFAVTQYLEAKQQTERANGMLQTLRTNLNFLVYDLDDVLENYVPIKKQNRVMDQVNTMIDTLKEHGDNTVNDRRDQAKVLMDEAALLSHTPEGLKQAQQKLLQAHAIFLALADEAPDNSESQHDLSVSYNKLGDIYQAQGNLSEALKAFQASLGIRETLAAADPSHSGWQQDLVISYVKLSAVTTDQAQKMAWLQKALILTKTLKLKGHLYGQRASWVEGIEGMIQQAQADKSVASKP